MTEGTTAPPAAAHLRARRSRNPQGQTVGGVGLFAVRVPPDLFEAEKRTFDVESAQAASQYRDVEFVCSDGHRWSLFSDPWSVLCCQAEGRHLTTQTRTLTHSILRHLRPQREAGNASACQVCVDAPRKLTLRDGVWDATPPRPGCRRAAQGRRRGANITSLDNPIRGLPRSGRSGFRGLNVRCLQGRGWAGKVFGSPLSVKAPSSPRGDL